MIQDLIVYLLVAGAVGKVCYQFVMIFQKKNKGALCSSGCGGCGMKKEIA